MKSKKIDNLRYQDYDITHLILETLVVLESIGIKSATEAADECQSIIDDEFCGECKSDHSHCECVRERDYDDGDRAYDAWKDAQLENED